jgi:hypothetical protein
MPQSSDGPSGDSIASPTSTTTDSPSARGVNTSESTSNSKVTGPFYARWNDDMLSTGFDVSTLPTCARMLIVLTSVSPATLEEKRLAVVALPLFDENRVIRGGRWAMRMFHCTSSDSSDGVGIATRGSSVGDGDGSGSEHSDDGLRARSGSKAFGSPQPNSGDTMSSKASLGNSFPLHVVAGSIVLSRRLLLRNSSLLVLLLMQARTLRMKWTTIPRLCCFNWVRMRFALSSMQRLTV